MNAVAPIADEPEAFERVPPAGVQWHPYADLFPWIEGPAFDDLKADIAENGVLEPIVFFEGQILDGRNRYMAARDLGIEYPRVEYRGDDCRRAAQQRHTVALDAAKDLHPVHLAQHDLRRAHRAR